MPKTSAGRAFRCVDHFRVIEGTSVGGATTKDVLEDPATGARYIAKLGRRLNDLEVMTEFAIHVIGRSLGVVVADAEIASFRGQFRFLSRYFLDPNQGEELVHGVQLFQELYNSTIVQGVLEDEVQEQAMFTVQAVEAAFGAHYVHFGPAVVAALFDGFVAMLTHDALIGVQDRHHENWGVIVQRDLPGAAPRFAPLYDSARGLFCNELDDKLKARFALGRPGSERLDGYVERARPLVGFAGLKPEKKRKYVTHGALVAAIYRGYPNQRPKIMGVLDAYEWQVVRDRLRAGLGPLCSPFRLTLMLTCLRRRRRAVRRAIHEFC